MSILVSMTGIIKKKVNNLLKVRRSWFTKIITASCTILLCFLIGLPLYVFSVGINLFGLFGDMPDFKDVENPENDLSSELISADGVSLGRYYRHNRSQVSYEELSPALVNSLLLSEDHRFYDHSGLDFVAFLRVIGGILTFSPDGGGSTLTQQLAKNLYTRNPDHSLDGPLANLGKFPARMIQKTKEWIISVDLERNFTKNEIIAMYLNTAQFNHNAYGIKIASETYFSKSPDKLDLREAALLVGMLQNPRLFDPVNRPKQAIKKRNEVLLKIHKARYKLITKQQLDSISSRELGLRFRVLNHNEGLATYFRTVITSKLKKICAQKGIDLRVSGLKIHTTIDSRLQRYAEYAMNEHMKKLQSDFMKEWNGENPWRDDDGNEIPDFLDSRIQKSNAYRALTSKYGKNSDSIRIMLHTKKRMNIFTWRGERDTLFSSMDSLAYYKRFLQSGLVSIDPSNGHVKAWVGGFNYKYFQFDHVQQSKRQPGSTFKPFVYGFAMETGHSPCEIREDVSPAFKLADGKTWYPKNADGKYGTGKKMTLRQAMATSVNSITAQIMKEVGVVNVVAFAHDMGIQSPLDTVPSLCLGVSDVSLLEMVGAYGTFVNSGVRVEPFYITRIEDKNGNVIENFTPSSRQAINPDVAQKMIYMLRGGVDERHGTSEGLSEIIKSDNEVGGKTGTTNNASDGWYIGITHNLVTGVWVGGDERNIRFREWRYGQGGKTARPIWDKYMVQIYQDSRSGISKGKFNSGSLDTLPDCGGFDADSVRSLDIR